MTIHDHLSIDMFLRPGVYVDSESVAVNALTESALRGLAVNAVERGVALYYYAARDGLKV